MLNATHRRYLYRLGQAAIVVAAGYGILADDKAALWALLLAPLLGLADANVPDDLAAPTITENDALG